MRNFEVIKDKGVPVKAWVKGVKFEEDAKKQLLNVSQLPFIHRWLACMPDVHAGWGSTIGSVIPTKKAIIPAAVGKDLGCGMMAIQTTLTSHDLTDGSDKFLFDLISRVVPHGRTDNGGFGDRGAWGNTPPEVDAAWMGLEDKYKKIVGKHPKAKHHRQHHHLGTMGGGNHFFEVCLDESDRVWLMLHSGSRGVGNRIGTYFIELAKKEMERWFIHLPDTELAYLPEGSTLFDDYVEAMLWAQEFARINREVMMNRVLSHLKEKWEGFDTTDVAVNCHHNYATKEHHYGENVWVTRKGAVCAREGLLGIIPGSMGEKSYIVRGRGNPESFHSCSHGAGRTMSRTDAKKLFTIEDHTKATEGVYCDKTAGTLDESPGSYKPIDDVMKAQEDLVEVVHTLKQIVCVKGKEGSRKRRKR